MGNPPIYEIVSVNAEEIVVRDHGAPDSPQDFSLQASQREILEFAGLMNLKGVTTKPKLHVHIRSIEVAGTARFCNVSLATGKSRQNRQVTVSPELFEKLEYIFRWRAMDWELRPVLPPGVRTK